MTGVLFEQAVEIRYVGYRQFGGNILYQIVGGEDHQFGSLHLQVVDIVDRREACFLPEDPRQVVGRQAAHLRKFRYF